MKYCVIASGSKGNMTYIETEQTKLLIDAGISLKEAKARLDIDYTNLDAILITHAHGDHIGGLLSVVKESNAKVYVTKETFGEIATKYKDKIIGMNVSYIEPNQTFKINDVKVFSMRLSHDTKSCVGFVIVGPSSSMGYVTDTGFLPIPYIDILKKVDSLIIESNHDIELLNKSNRPWYLKERILSVEGHMSNYICGQVLNTIVQNKKLKTVVLAHLSEEVNTEEIALETVIGSITSDYLPKIYIAKQRVALDFIEVNGGN